jgi:hypothetical protein
MSTGNCLAMAGLGLAPYGPTHNNLVLRGHFDTGYANLRQVTYLSAKFKEKSCLAFKKIQYDAN